jgi:putative FmdB family regulatory protein
MPIYEYACTSCGERTEAKQSFDDPPLETCPKCSGKLRKLYSPVGIVFKGSGFYATDSKKSSKSQSSSSSGSSSSSAPSSSDSSSSSKSSDSSASSGPSPSSGSASGSAAPKGSSDKKGS